MKAISTVHVSPALLKELRLAMARRKKSERCMLGSAAPHPEAGSELPNNSRASEKINELWRLDGARQQAPSTWRWVHLNSHGRTTCCRQPAASSRQPRPSGGGATYTAVLAGPVAPTQPSEPLKPTAMDSNPSEPGVSMETTNSRMSSNMSGPLSGTPDGTTSNAQVANACLPAGKGRNKTPIFISGVSDTRSFLAWLRASCPGGLMAH